MATAEWAPTTERGIQFSLEGAEDAVRLAWYQFVTYPEQQPQIEKFLGLNFSLEEVRRREGQEHPNFDLLQQAQNLNSAEGREAAREWFGLQEAELQTQLTALEKAQKSPDGKGYNINVLWARILATRKAVVAIP